MAFDQVSSEQITYRDLPSEFCTLIIMSLNAKNLGNDRCSSSLAIAATECFVAAFPSMNDDVRAVARRVRDAGSIASRVAALVDYEVRLLLAALFHLRGANKISIHRFLPTLKSRAIADLWSIYGVDSVSARQIVQ